MPFMKQGQPWLYDDATGDMIGIKDPDGGERFFDAQSYTPDTLPNSDTLAPGSTVVFSQSGVSLAILQRTIANRLAAVTQGRFANALDFGIPTDGSDIFPRLNLLLTAIKNGQLNIQGLYFPKINAGYNTSQQIKITFPLHIHLDADLRGTFTTKQSVLLFEGQYSTSDETKLLNGCGVTGNGSAIIDGNGRNVTGYTYSTEDTYYSCVLFKWCDAPVASRIRGYNGLVNCIRTFQCRRPVIHDCEGFGAQWDNGISMDFDAPIYQANNPNTWSYGVLSNCRGYDNRNGLGITSYGAVMRMRMHGCLAWNNGAKTPGELGASGVIGGGISIEDDFNNQHTKVPRIVVLDCHAWNNANGFFISADYVTIEPSCTSNDNTYPLDPTDSANTHGNGYSLVNTRHVRCLGQSRGNFKRGLYGLGYAALRIDNATIGGTHKNNLIGSMMIQGAGRVLIDNPECVSGGSTQPSIQILNIVDYGIGEGNVTIRNPAVSLSGNSAIKVQGVGDIKITNATGDGNGAVSPSPSIMIDGCVTATVDGAAFTGSTNTNVVSVNSATTKACVRNVAGESTSNLVVNNAQTVFGADGLVQSVGNVSPVAPQGQYVTIRFTAAITADRTVTLNTTNPSMGDRVRVVRAAAATGAFNVVVGSSLKTLSSASTWCDVEYNGSAWILAASGSL